MRGEHHTKKGRQSSDGGSSPLARGTLNELDTEDQELGIIPACAGNTDSQLKHSGHRTDHPRLRGEHMFWPAGRSLVCGSSPLARGTRSPIGSCACLSGIIPACAGNTTVAAIRRCRARDHPRLRGEHSHWRLRTWRISGSSPLARGTLRSLSALSLAAGIIPACAGNTPRPRRSPAWAWDHPRLRGEHVLVRSLVCVLLGSSPLARGTLIFQYDRVSDFGIIPACAGNTWGGACGGSCLGDHPRLRGEHGIIQRVHNGRRGSSPLARGTPPIRVMKSPDGGIIPACAGNTTHLPILRDMAEDHPRLRGEHKSSVVGNLPDVGSSPLARGTRPWFQGHGGRKGIIPACAGNTCRRSRRTRTPTDHPRLRGEHLVGSSGCAATTGSSPLARGTLQSFEMNLSYP